MFLKILIENKVKLARLLRNPQDHTNGYLKKQLKKAKNICVVHWNFLSKILTLFCSLCE
jgi:hypothetical protein